MNLITMIWIAGFLLKGYRYCRSNQAIHSYILAAGKDVTKDPRYESIMDEILGKKASALRIFEVPDLGAPLIFGLTNPYILIPDKLSCSDRELTYILRHEVSHYLHHDLIIKFFVKLLTIIYWWNPFGYLIDSQTSLILEMRIDDTVADRDAKETAEYLQCLLHLAEYQDKMLSDSMGNLISFAHGNDEVTKKRFQMLIQRKQKKNKVLNLLLICLVSCIYLLSYLIIFEANNPNRKEDVFIYSFDESNSYFIENEDGTYDLYFNNYKLETVDSLDYYNGDIPVYSMEEYEHVQQEDPE